MFSLDDIDLINDELINLLFYPDNHDINELYNRSELLSIDLSANALQLNIEKIRGQKLNAKLNRTKRENTRNIKSSIICRQHLRSIVKARRPTKY